MKRVIGLGLVTAAAALLHAQALAVGAKVNGFTVNDPSGNPAPFSTRRGGTTVVVFIATKCPISNDYNERMKALYSDYGSKGVKFVFINSNATEPASEVAEHARANGFPFQVYKDPKNVVADQFGAQFTPEAYVIDQADTLRYHGHIDDSRNASRIQSQTLRAALDAVLTGKPVATAETKAFGCTIKRAK